VARVFITGSADGIGRLTAQLLVAGGHDVVLHARSERRAADARAGVPEAREVVVGDLSSIAAVRSVAEQINAAEPLDAVVHNAAVGDTEPSRIETVDGLAHVFAVNVLAPYLLTALIGGSDLSGQPGEPGKHGQPGQPGRLVYVSSGMQLNGARDLDDAQWTRRRWSGSRAYSDSKLFLTMLAFAVARRRPAVRSNSADPGWVPTRMGGPGATDDLSLAPVTQAWLATDAEVTGEHFFHRQPASVHPDTRVPAYQEELLAYCATLTGVTF
jgi:NAD(P)-dependent dehydrogenase (short-subunit alcohol dehydrogenase family)